mmetsp:Transcript_14272/g.21760  ORF Transcript_14272/g.21760 Transcript_14272/m.21760 type:complete len:89 (+) Transcript_14272:142-408(+)
MSEAVQVVDLEAAQSHIGSAVMNLDGTITRLGGKMTESNASTLFKMLVETTMLENDGDFKRFVVSFDSCNFAVARDSNHVFILQTKAT